MVWRLWLRLRPSGKRTHSMRQDVAHHRGATERLLLRVLRESLMRSLALLLLLLWDALRWLLRGWLLLRGERWCPLGLTHLYGVEKARHGLGERVALLRTHIGGVYVV